MADQGKSAGKQNARARKVRQSQDRKKLQAIEQKFGRGEKFTKKDVKDKASHYFPTPAHVGDFVARMVRKGIFKIFDDGKIVQVRRTGIASANGKARKKKTAESKTQTKPKSTPTPKAAKPAPEAEKKESDPSAAVDTPKSKPGTVKSITREMYTKTRVELLDVFTDKHVQLRPSQFGSRNEWFAQFTWPAIGAFMTMLANKGEVEKSNSQYKATKKGFKVWKGLVKAAEKEAEQEKKKKAAKDLPWTDRPENQTKILAAIAKMVIPNQDFLKRGVHVQAMTKPGGIMDILKKEKDLPTYRTIVVAYRKLEENGWLECDNSSTLRRWKITAAGWNHLRDAEVELEVPVAPAVPEPDKKEKAAKPAPKPKPAVEPKPAKPVPPSRVRWIQQPGNMDKVLLAISKVIAGRKNFIRDGISLHMLRNKERGLMAFLPKEEGMPNYRTIVAGFRDFEKIGYLQRQGSKFYVKLRITEKGWKRIKFIKEDLEAKAAGVTDKPPVEPEPEVEFESNVVIDISSFEELRAERQQLLAEQREIERQLKENEVNLLEQCAEKIAALLDMSGLSDEQHQIVISKAKELLAGKNEEDEEETDSE